MRLGVLDVGSNTVHLLVVDAHHGARPLPAASRKSELRLAELLEDGRLTADGADRLSAAVADAAAAAEDLGVEDLLAFATSAVREAGNGQEVLDRVRGETGVGLRVLSGEDEARLTFLAVRRWCGWSAGHLLVLDIGGGSLEVATGIDEEPAAAVSMPLGAGRLTRDLLPDRGAGVPDAEDLRALRRHVRSVMAQRARDLRVAGAPDRAVVTSKTFRTVARIAGAAPSGEGDYVRRTLTLDGARDVAARVASMTVAERTRLPAVSESRAAQLVAGAVVAEAALELFGATEVELCPWALREGVILRRLDQLVTP